MHMKFQYLILKQSKTVYSLIMKIDQYLLLVVEIINCELKNQLMYIVNIIRDKIKII